MTMRQKDSKRTRADALRYATDSKYLITILAAENNISFIIITIIHLLVHEYLFHGEFWQLIPC